MNKLPWTYSTVVRVYSNDPDVKSPQAAQGFQTQKKTLHYYSAPHRIHAHRDQRVPNLQPHVNSSITCRNRPCSSFSPLISCEEMQSCCPSPTVVGRNDSTFQSELPEIILCCNSIFLTFYAKPSIIIFLKFPLDIQLSTK